MNTRSKVKRQTHKSSANLKSQASLSREKWISQLTALPGGEEGSLPPLPVFFWQLDFNAQPQVSALLGLPRCMQWAKCMHKALYTYCNINFVALVCYPHILHKKEFLSLLNNLQLSCEYISLRNVTLDINTVNPFQPNDAVRAMDWKGLIFIN